MSGPAGFAPTLLRWLSGRFGRFLLASGTAAIVNFASRIGLSLFMPYVAAIVVAYALGMVTAFVLNRLFVFDTPIRNTTEQVFWFIAVNLLGVAQTLLVSLAFARWILPAIGWHAHTELVAHAIGIVTPVFTSYLLHKRLAFRSE